MTATPKYDFVFRTQYRGYRLRHEPVVHGRNFNKALFSGLLRRRIRDKRRTADTALLCVPELAGAVRLQMGEQFPDLHAVSTSTAFIRDDGFERLDSYCREQACSPD